MFYHVDPIKPGRFVLFTFLTKYGLKSVQTAAVCRFWKTSREYRTQRQRMAVRVDDSDYGVTGGGDATVWSIYADKESESAAE